jgi:Fic family protein
VADWDTDSPELEDNLRRVLEGLQQAAARREPLTAEAARRWHSETMRHLDVPDLRYIGAFRGEPGLEKVQVRVNGRYGVAARDVDRALAAFEQTLQQIIERLDELIPFGVDSNSDQIAAVLEVCAWVHAEWIRIHPFANGNGRTARLWVNGIAMRYNLPPFLRLRPRPDSDYAVAGAEAMRGHWEPTIAVLRRSLEQFRLELSDDQAP